VIGISIAQLFNFLDTTPPVGPAIGIKDQIPDFLLRGANAPDGVEIVLGHAFGVRRPVGALLRED
jgi:hypothetical protein